MNDFARLLHASAPHPEHTAALQLYGRFVGDWDAEITAFGPDGRSHTAPGEIHFGWVLEGRAVQDVWIIPRPAGSAAFPIAGNWYGTTLRVYDPAMDAWRISWFDPGRRVFRQQIGRPRGEDIVQEGTTESGELTRWSFTEITGDSFRWRGEVKPATAVDWRLMVEVRARRRTG
ncbi:hypothetical protein ABH999_001522 [Bradyrhizobium yuanmingense]|uniref:hypothetical protein n=1 Tax=Bradyrhizobium yuanmingense TaxID=108015 RepID=UPI0004B6455A|nr:hypothetical protein [Bradyrhizobium yuanmingense]